MRKGKEVRVAFVCGMVMASLLWVLFFVCLIEFGKSMDEGPGAMYDQQSRGISTDKQGLKHDFK